MFVHFWVKSCAICLVRSGTGKIIFTVPSAFPCYSPFHHCSTPTYRRVIALTRQHIDSTSTCCLAEIMKRVQVGGYVSTLLICNEPF
jgi:hypothetical protein